MGQARRPQPQQQPQWMNVHLLANPGDSLLLQHTLDQLIRWLYPTLRIFHVSERASSFRTAARACPVAGKRTVPWRSRFEDESFCLTLLFGCVRLSFPGRHVVPPRGVRRRAYPQSAGLLSAPAVAVPPHRELRQAAGRDPPDLRRLSQRCPATALPAAQ